MLQPRWAPARRSSRRLAYLLILVGVLASAAMVTGEGSGTIYRGPDPARFRGHMEWRTSDYGGGDSPDFLLRRRTLLYAFVQAGESLQLGSSGVGVTGNPNLGDIWVFNPGQVSGPIGQEQIPALAGLANPPQQGGFSNGFGCEAQRSAAGDGRGRIADRAQELAGPLPSVGGFAPCVYVAPQTGLYAIVFLGPSGPNSDTEPQVSGLLEAPPADFGPNQRTSVTAWDVTVRDTGGAPRFGRLFSYYYTANTGGGGRPVGGEAHVVTNAGFRYRVFFDGDPFGFVFYANQLGFQDSDGAPLYRNLLASPLATTQEQNQLRELQGGARLLPPTFPLFISEPDPLALDALGIPSSPIAPAITELRFSGPDADQTTAVGVGGSFSFSTTQAGSYYIVVSRDGLSFDPTAPGNRVLRGVAAAVGPVTVAWDGLDNDEQPFPAGDFLAAAAVLGGEVHFPFLDVENNIIGGPVVGLENPPDLTGDGVGDCPPWQGGCFGAFYDDRGYRTADNTLVGTAVNGPLCAGDAANPAGFGNPPQIAASDPLRGFDSRTGQRAFGFPFDANPGSVCLINGGFGDKKGLDLWTYYPSNVLQTPLRIIDPTAVTLRSLTASRVGDAVEVRWETGSELNTLGFHILRGASGAPETAVRVTPALISARGGGVYSWTDGAPVAGAAYWLEEHEVSGRTLRYGPAQIAAVSADGAFTVRLPLLSR